MKDLVHALYNSIAGSLPPQILIMLNLTIIFLDRNIIEGTITNNISNSLRTKLNVLILYLFDNNLSSCFLQSVASLLYLSKSSLYFLLLCVTYNKLLAMFPIEWNSIIGEIPSQVWNLDINITTTCREDTNLHYNCHTYDILVSQDNNMLEYQNKLTKFLIEFIIP